MEIVLSLLLIQGIIGAFDTLFYHEWKAKLVAGGEETALELKIHAYRDFLYGIIFGTLPIVKWHGTWALVLTTIFMIEIVLTLWDFFVEIDSRKSIGDVFKGERVTHAVMGIIYGGMLGNMIPIIIQWYHEETDFIFTIPQYDDYLRWSLLAMAVGVCFSGLRDLYGAYQLPYGNWPWRKK